MSYMKGILEEFLELKKEKKLLCKRIKELEARVEELLLEDTSLKY